MLIKNAKVITPDGVRRDLSVITDDDMIVSLTDRDTVYSDDEIVIDAGGRFLSPGFIDIHCHGGGGADFMDGTPEAFRTACSEHLKHGTTTIVPTSVSASADAVKAFTDSFKVVKNDPELPDMPGFHLEGPFLSEHMAGAIDPNYICLPDKDHSKQILDICGKDLLRWTIAPELAGACELGRECASRGIFPSIGHSNGYYEDAVKAVKNGFKTVTHIYSSMSSVRREGGFRRSGILEAALLLDELYVELIADCRHLPVELLKLIYRLKGPSRMILVTDAMRAAGTDTVRSTLGNINSGLDVIIEDGVAKMPDRSGFAGSIATADTLLRTMNISAGIGIDECIRMMTSVPASVIGIAGIAGSVSPGYRADLVIFDDEIKIQNVILKGRSVYGDNCKSI